jgi:hypothetical protein
VSVQAAAAAAAAAAVPDIQLAVFSILQDVGFTTVGEMHMLKNTASEQADPCTAE